MKTHILIPSVNSYSVNIYGVMLLAMLSLGSFTIARHVHIRWLKTKFSFIGSNAVVKMAIALMGLFIIPVSDLFSLNVSHEICGILAGLAMGFMTVFLEIQMIRKVNRKSLVKKNYQYRTNEDNHLRNAIFTKKMTLASAKTITAKGLTHIRQSYSQYANEPNFLNYSLMSVITVGIAEEFLFRGYLISIAELMQNRIEMIAIIFCSLILFAFSHVSHSWNEFKCKLPLSIFTTADFIVTGTLLSSIATHLTLNIYAYLQLKKNNSTSR